MRFHVAPEDFLKGELPALGWHPAQIVKWDETSKTAGATSKNPGSQLTVVNFKILAGPSKDKVVFTNFSEVAPVFMVPLLEALGATINKKEAFDFEVNEASMMGKFVDIHLIAGTYQNKPNRQIDGYRPYTGPKVTETQEAGV